jgi:hypothetical protein
MLIGALELAGMKPAPLLISFEFILLALAVLVILIGVYLGVVLATVPLGAVVYAPRWLRDMALRESPYRQGTTQAGEEG